MRIQIDTLKQMKTKTKTKHKNKSQNLFWSLQSKIKTIFLGLPRSTITPNNKINLPKATHKKAIHNPIFKHLLFPFH